MDDGSGGGNKGKDLNNGGGDGGDDGGDDDDYFDDFDDDGDGGDDGFFGRRSEIVEVSAWQCKIVYQVLSGMYRLEPAENICAGNVRCHRLEWLLAHPHLLLFLAPIRQIKG